MAVAEKKPGAHVGSKPLPLPVASILGAGYVIGALALVFTGLPLLWDTLGLTGGQLYIGALKVLVVVVSIVALFVIGVKLLGSKPTPGLKAGIFTALVLLFFWALISRWIGGILEGWTTDGFLKNLGPSVGMGIFAVISLLILFWFTKIFFRPTFQKRMVRFDAAGWFSFGAYKPGQGLKVRRGTMLGIMLIAGAGIFVLTNRGLESGDWSLSIPFTGEAVVTAPGSALKLPDLDEDLKAGLEKTEKKDKPETFVISQAQLDKLNNDLQPGVKRLITNPDFFAKYVDRGKINEKYKFKENEIVPGSTFEEAVEAIKVSERKDGLTATEIEETELEANLAAQVTKPLEYQVRYSSILLLPDVEYALPLVLILLTLWFAWRVINLPVFGDFLIATEAEMNKVSWTTKSKLYQDTIVVLATLVLMATFFYFVDFIWYKTLSWKPIGVLKIPEESKEQNVERDQLRW